MTRKILSSKCAALAIGVAGALVSANSAGASDRVEIGLLRCDVAGASNFLIGSTKRLDCRFEPAAGGTVELYAGEITRVGIDLGSTRDIEIRWTVLAPNIGRPTGSLAGSYAGVSAEASAGAGVGANALIGGLERSIALNPLSVQTQSGVNLAAGIAGLKLTAR